jgi:hypothetical protein
LEIDTTKLKTLPLARKHQDRVAHLAEQLSLLAAARDSLSPDSVIFGEWEPDRLAATLAEARAERELLRRRMVALQEELDWTLYVAYGLAPEEQLVPLTTLEPLESGHRPFAIRLARRVLSGAANTYWFESMGVSPVGEVPLTYGATTRATIDARIALTDASAHLTTLEATEHKRKWEPLSFDVDLRQAARSWLADRMEQVLMSRARPATREQIAAAIQDDGKCLAILTILQQRRDVDVAIAVEDLLRQETVPSHPFHVYTEAGLVIHRAWERMWELQRRESDGEAIKGIPIPPEYSQGSRGKPVHFVTDEIWRLRGSFDVPKERFIAFSEVPGRSSSELLFGWAGWSATQRLKAILAIDEELEDGSVSLSDRIGLLDSAWRLLSEVAIEDGVAATRLKAELQALVGPEGPSRELIEDWKKRFPPPTTRATRTKRAAAAREGDDGDDEESDES